jgi:hypothetical protein
VVHCKYPRHARTAPLQPKRALERVPEIASHLTSPCPHERLLAAGPGRPSKT